jgi:predicted DNA binding CopG/RHH family protein
VFTGVRLCKAIAGRKNDERTTKERRKNDERTANERRMSGERTTNERRMNARARQEEQEKVSMAAAASPLSPYVIYLRMILNEVSNLAA